MIEQLTVLSRQEQHTQDLRAEAARERLAGQRPARAGWQCQVCLRIGRLLVALGRRLEIQAAGGITAQLGGSNSRAAV